MAGRIANLIDNTIGVFSARAMLNRKRDRALAAVYDMQGRYAAAERTRLNADWITPLDSENQTIELDLPTMIGRSRDLERSTWAGASISLAYRRHIGRGIRIRATARHPSTKKKLSDFNLACNRNWREYTSNPALIDVEGRKSFEHIQCMVAQEIAIAGGVFIFKAVVDGRLQLQVVEIEQLAWDLFTVEKQQTDTNRIVGGIEIAPTGKPVAYWIYLNGHPYENFGLTPTRVPADRVYHVFNQRRPRQCHGIPITAPVMNNIRHLTRYDEYMIVRARFAACVGGFVIHDVEDREAELMALQQVLGDNQNDSKGNAKAPFEPGMFIRLRPGQDFKQFTTQEASSQYEAFVKQQLRQIAAGAGLDYQMLLRDWSGATFTAQREGKLERWNEEDIWHGMLITQLIKPFRTEWLALEIASGRLEAPEFFVDEEFRRQYESASYVPPPREWIDPLKQAAAVEKAIQNRLVSRSDVIAETSGEEAEDVFNELAEEEEYLREKGLAMDPAEKAEMNESGFDEEDEDAKEERGTRAMAKVFGINYRNGNGVHK